MRHKISDNIICLVACCIVLAVDSLIVTSELKTTCNEVSINLEYLDWEYQEGKRVCFFKDSLANIYFRTFCVDQDALLEVMKPNYSKGGTP